MTECHNQPVRHRPGLRDARRVNWAPRWEETTMKTATFAFLLIIAGCLVSCSPGGEKGAAPRSGSSEKILAPVLRVYSAKEGDYKFVAYVVKWKDAEIVVSDTLAQSDFHPGDTISFFSQKIHLNKGVAGRPVDTLSFQIIPWNQPAVKAK